MKTVFCGGGTAGHITPNLALIDRLTHETNYYIGTDGMEKKLTQSYVRSGKIAEFCEISAAKLQRRITLANLKIPFRFVKSVKEAKLHLKRIRPDIVFSKGGFVGLPVVVAAHALKIPTIVHESDLSLGLANRISLHFADKFLSAYPCHKKCTVVGAIIRDRILKGNKQKGLSAMGFDGAKPVLLVMGGSLGAKALNDAVCSAPQLAHHFDIFMICGKGKKVDCSFATQAEFVNNIEDVFAATDVCLTRAGSNSLAELTLAGVPFVAVPLTKRSRGEQVRNAQWFAERGCGTVLFEENLQKCIAEKVIDVYNNRKMIAKMQEKQQYLFGTEKVLQEILKYK